MVLRSKKLDNLSFKYQICIRNFDMNIITKREFNKKRIMIYKEMDEERNALIKEDKIKDEEKEKMAEEISKPVEKTEKVEKPAKVEKIEKVEKVEKKEKVEKTEKVKPKGTNKPKKDSNASLIAKALMMKSVKKAETVAEKVIEWKPEVNNKKIITMTSVIINEVKKGKGRWKLYDWNEENYLLTKKETSE